MTSKQTQTTPTAYSNLPTFNQLSRYLNGLLFICYLVFILFVESFFYFMDNNYYSFIQRITYKLSQVNILYVKLFQAIALNHQYIDESLNQFLLTFTDNSPWCLDDIDYETLIGITNDYNIVLQDGFEKPINTGMVSLVFKGTMDSSPVVIKIKRRNIEFKLECAIENVLCLLSLLSFIPFIQKYEIESLVTRNIYLIREQLNFSKEVTNMMQVKENFTHFKYIKIPTVYSNRIQYPNAIIMEYIEGKSITDVNPEDYEHFAKQILKFGTVSILIHGLSHGDLHAGNILFIKDDKETFDKHKYKLGILDFGIMYSIEKNFQEVLYDIMDGLSVVDKSVLAKKIIDSGMFIQPIETIQSLPIKDYENIIYMLTNILADVFAIDGSVSGLGNCNQIKFYYFIRDFHKYMSTFLPQYHLTMSNNVIKTQLALAMTHGVTMKLCKDNWTPLFAQVMNEMFHTDIFKE